MQSQSRRFDAETIRFIRTSPLSGGVLGDKYGVSRSCICKIRKGFVYKEVGHGKANVGLPK